MAGGDLSEEVLNAISVIERVGSVFSMLGCLFVILTFSFSKAFHKPINRLVFYASFGNLMTNVGSLLSRRYVLEIDTFGCQFQAFLIQMFLPADALWTLAMAFNVYLTFYHKFDAARLRKMEIYYLLFCYGIPFVPALTYVFVRTEKAGRMYGNATLWCWVSSEFDIFRIATFYGPVWVVILLTMFIYIRTGGEIYRKRKQLRQFGASSSAHDPEAITMDDPYSIKTTEVTVTSESAQESANGIDLAPLGRFNERPKPAYSVMISSDNKKGSMSQQGGNTRPPPSNIPPTPSTARAQAKSQKRRANFEANNAAWSYSKCALLFFTALLVTWIPSSANRVYSLVNTNKTEASLEIMSAIVLPLQGFWNMLIYIATSWEAVKITFTDVMTHINGHHPEPNRYPSDYNDKHNFAFRLSSRSPRRDVESESMTELANSGRTSNSAHDSKR
ncbi:family A G protein-coupled receptor-like protein [Annulohypoxylon maeteangense]|uniref:family A G protein-coupled receptor-like protein n=1 Tax=Annulohypoxylon maeteangense TaxID=1927788 RepID=UPI0020076FA8|nr:family A G protein-coupled receptor-like protein [Annulohypoxylon maeteangense]KAI0881137.1 family A G protein-coupled receptor-like protein [Annulohypoxylon maeteangense]